MAKKQSIKQEKPEKMRLTVDYAFKRVFGRNGNEGILKDFLESILDIEIKDITIQNPEIPKNMRDSKIGILDVRAEINGKEIIEVEMQVQNQYNIDKRSPIYITKIYSDQLKEGDSYVKVKKVAVINILNFNYYERNSYHSIGRMKFENSKENEKIKEAKSKLEKLEMSPEDRELYELRLKAIRDEINIRESGYTDGMRDGEEKGKKEIAKNLLKQNIAIDIISQATGLTQEEIEKLKD